MLKLTRVGLKQAGTITVLRIVRGEDESGMVFQAVRRVQYNEWVFFHLLQYLESIA